MLAALSVGAEDVEFGEGDVVRIICAAGKLEQVAELLEFEDDVHVYAKRLCYQPQAYLTLHGEQEIEAGHRFDGGFGRKRGRPGCGGGF